MKKKALSHFNRPLILTIVVVILVAFGIYTYRNFVSKQTEETGSLSKAEMLTRGIHPDAVNIKILEGITAQWQDKSVAYNLEKVYLTPDIADLGSSRNDVSIKDKNFLVVELSVRDRRTTGDRRLIPAGNYLRLRKEQVDSAPVVSDYLYLSPQENGVIYVTFPVEKGISQFTLLVGILSSPRVIELDFDSNGVNTKEGVFILKGGYFPEYSPELHP